MMKGTPSQKTTLIENGKLVSYMQDRQNARFMKTKLQVMEEDNHMHINLCPE